MICTLSLELNLAIFHNKDRLFKLFLITFHYPCISFGKNNWVGIAHDNDCVYFILCKSVSSTMFSYIYMQIDFVYLPYLIFDMCIYVCMFVFIHIYIYM